MAQDAPRGQKASFATLLHAALDPNLECVAPHALLAATRLLRSVRILLYRQQPQNDIGPHVPSSLPGVVLRYMTLVSPRRLPSLTPAQRSAKAAKRVGSAGISGAAAGIAWASAITMSDGVSDPEALRVSLNAVFVLSEALWWVR